MQTIARANRVYDDEKENGLIVDYGNVYKQLEKAYSVYGEAGEKGKTKIDDEDEDSGQPVEKLVELVSELSDTILVVRQFLQDLPFDLDKLIHAGSALEKLSQLKLATNAVCLNETTRTQYEVAARDVFRKYKALYPEPEIKPFLKDFNAIEAIYDQLNQKTMQADISDVIRRLQQEVNVSITSRDNEVRDVDYVDLSSLDFDKLRAAFAKSNQKNAVVFDLQEAIQKKLEQMVQQNPIRLEFYEKYQKIIEAYNQGKDIQAVQKAFDDLNDFMQNDLAPEMERAMREELDEETLAIFDLLKKPELTPAEEKKVKEVAKQTLATLKEEKLKIERWRESTQVTAQVKTMIDHSLQWLPQDPYPDEELNIRSLLVYQHIYANYQGAGVSRYGSFY
jgi:type I restriction enzyme R subunit